MIRYVKKRIKDIYAYSVDIIIGLVLCSYQLKLLKPGR